MKVRSGVRVHQFSDNSGILFYNTLSEESTIVSCEYCRIEAGEDGNTNVECVVNGNVQLQDESNDVMEQLVRKRFIER